MDILTYINRMNQIYGDKTQFARITDAPFMAPELQEDINPMPNIKDLLREEGIQVGQQVKDGGRIYDTRKYFKPGGLVEPGVMYYGKKDPLTYSRLPEGFTQEQINIARAEIKRRAKIRGLPEPDFITFPGKGYKKDTPGYSMAKNVNRHVRHGDLSTLGKGKGVLAAEVGAAEGRKVVERSGQIKVFDMLLENPELSVQDISKELNIDKKSANRVMSNLLKNIYGHEWELATGIQKKKGLINKIPLKDKSLSTSAFLNEYDLEDVKKVKRFIRDSKGFKDVYERSIYELALNAYEGKPKLLQEAYKRLNSWFEIQKAFKQQAPKLYEKFASDLDHPLSFKSLEAVGAGSEAFVRVTPIPKSLNRGIKSHIDKGYKNIIKAIKKNPTNKDLILKKSKMERFVKKIGFKMGKADKMGNRVISYEAKALTKSNLGDEMLKNLDLETRIAKKVAAFKGDDLKKITGELFKTKTPYKTLMGFQKNNPKELAKAKTILKRLIEEFGCGTKKATGGRVGFAEGSGCLEKGREKVEKLLINGTGSTSEKGMISKIIQGAGTLLSPKELIRPVNLFGPAALAILSGIEGGIISNDVITKGTPIKEALGANWMTSWAMPKTLMEYQIQDLRKTGNLDSPVLKNFAKTTEQMAELDRLYNVLEINKAGGMSTVDTEKQIKKLHDEITSTMKKNNMTLASFEPGSAAMIEFQNKLTEKEAKQLASTKESNVSDLMRTGTLDMGNLKDPYKPMFGFDELKPKVSTFRVDPTKGRMSKTRTFKDYTIPTYKTMTEEPVTEEERVYQQKRYGLRPEQRLEDYTDSETGVNLAKALELKKKWTQALYQPGMMGTQEKFNTGGRVSFRFGGKGIDEGKRAFLKLLAALGIGTAGAKSGISLFGKAVGKKAVSTTGVDIVSSTQGMPSWFPALVNKIIKEGDDVTGKLATKERELVYTKKLPDGEEATVYRDLDTGDIRVDYDSVHNMGEGTAPVSLEYKAGQVIDEGKHAGKKTDPEFSAQEIEPVGYTQGPDDYAIEWDGSNVVGNVDDLVSDTSKLKNYAKGEKPTMKDIVTRKRKIDEVDEIHKNESDYIATKQGEGDVKDYDDYLPDIDDID